MSSKRDYYEVLGLSKGASSDEIRKAYRQAALKNHPDRNPDDPAAAERFKEATEAYSVLSDDDKRTRYDRFGHAGVEGMPDMGGADIFSHFQDIFSELFGGMGGPGGGRRRRGGPARGHDIRVQQRISLKEAMTGTKREVPLRTPVPCDDCDATGAKNPDAVDKCRTCGGVGQVSVSRGFVMFTQTCPSCSGRGQVVTDPCATCEGAGQVEKSRKVVVSFPAGVDAGQRLRVPGQGLPGEKGAPSGDLYVDVDVAPDENFEREGLDLITRINISFADAALGATVEVELPDESTVELAIPAGTQPGDVISTRGKGVPRVDGRGRGSLHAVVQVEVPKSLSKRARQLLRDLEEDLEKHRTKAKTA